MSSLSKTSQDYFRLTRLQHFPLGTLVIFTPAAMGAAMAAYAYETPAEHLARCLAIHFVACTFGHSTFCILNDIMDRDLDARVERTKNRPVASGTVPLFGAWMLFLGMLSLTTFSFSLMNAHAFIFGILSYPLHLVYPTSKRWTWWPQAWLGLSNGWSYLTGWFSIAGLESSRQNLSMISVMYAALICWTIYFDTVYATQDREEDARFGVLSTAQLFGSWVYEVTACFSAIVIALMIYGGILNKHGLMYFGVTCGGAACHFMWQLYRWNPSQRETCGKVFKSNGGLGLLMLCGILMDYTEHHVFVS